MTQALMYERILQEFKKIREWDDEIIVEEDGKSVSLSTGVDIKSQNGRLIIEASDANDIVDVFFYYGIECRKEKYEQMCILLNAIHQRWGYGRFELGDKGFIRWRHRVDFEGAQPSGTSIERIVQPGWDAVIKYADLVSAVALTKQTAADAIEDFDRDNA